MVAVTERADAARNRRAILRAALELYETAADPAAVTMDDVAAAAGRGCQRAATRRAMAMEDSLDQARYISLTTFKRDGTAVSTPVWVTGARGRYAFTTGDVAWKTKRLLRNPTVEVRVCDARGRVQPGAAAHPGTGEISTSAADVAAAQRALAAKYGWQWRASRIWLGVTQRLGRGPAHQVVAVHLAIPGLLP